MDRGQVDDAARAWMMGPPGVAFSIASSPRLLCSPYAPVGFGASPVGAVGHAAHRVRRGLGPRRGVGTRGHRPGGARGGRLGSGQRRGPLHQAAGTVSADLEDAGRRGIAEWRPRADSNRRSTAAAPHHRSQTSAPSRTSTHRTPDTTRRPRSRAAGPPASSGYLPPPPPSPDCPPPPA